MSAVILGAGQPPDAAQNTAAMAARLEGLESRVLRMEVGVSMILAHLGLTMPVLTMPVVPFPTAPAAAAAAAAVAAAAPVVKSGPYKYCPLEANKAEIRLLKVTTSQAESDPIQCSLIHVNLDNKWMPLFEFSALSYTWGVPKFDESIQVDGHKFPVTKNLKEALVRLRASPGPDINRPYNPDAPPVSYWWIDAVCINQADILERNAQVAVMRRIYHSAARVQVWLGEEADDSDAAFKLAIELEKSPPRRGPGVADPAPLVVPEDERRKNWKALTAIFARPVVAARSGSGRRSR